MRRIPTWRYASGEFVFAEFVSALGRMPSQSGTAPTSIFSLLYLDPLAGLDPTAAAIEETRELGERVMYYTQRMPNLLSWQAEVLAYQLADQPASQQVLDDASRLATSSEIFAQTAQQLPQLINDQRQAAIQQILDGLTVEGNKSRDLLTDTQRRTFDLEPARRRRTSTRPSSRSRPSSNMQLQRIRVRRPLPRTIRPFNVLSIMARRVENRRGCRQPQRTARFGKPKHSATGKARPADESRR